MTFEMPERQATTQITVIVSGVTSEISEPNAEDVGVAAVVEGGNQAAVLDGTVVHKNAMGVFSRRMIALEHRMDRIERQIRSLKFNMNGKLSRIENKLKALTKVQQEILRKLDELDHVRDATVSASSGPSLEHSSVSQTVDRLPLEQKRKRMWATKSLSVSSTVAQIRRRNHPRLEKLRPDSRTILIKCYKKMKAKRAALGSSHEHRSNGIGSSSTSTSETALEDGRILASMV